MRIPFLPKDIQDILLYIQLHLPGSEIKKDCSLIGFAGLSPSFMANIHGVQRFAQHISPEFGIKCLRNEISLVVYHWLLEQLCYIALFMAIFAAHSAALFILREGLLASNHRFSACLSGNTLSYTAKPFIEFQKL